MDQPHIFSVSIEPSFCEIPSYSAPVQAYSEFDHRYRTFSFLAHHVAIIVIITYHLLSFVGNLGAHGDEPLQRMNKEAHTIWIAYNLGIYLFHYKGLLSYSSNMANYARNV